VTPNSASQQHRRFRRRRVPFSGICRSFRPGAVLIGSSVGNMLAANYSSASDTKHSSLSVCSPALLFLFLIATSCLYGLAVLGFKFFYGFANGIVAYPLLLVAQSENDMGSALSSICFDTSAGFLAPFYSNKSSSYPKDSPSKVSKSGFKGFGFCSLCLVF